MSDWYGAARSNYFRVKDVTEFEKWCLLWGLTFVRKTDTVEGVEVESPDMVGFTCEGMKYGGLPSRRYEEVTETEIEFDGFMKELSGHLQDNEVAVMMETGAEKMCYVTGLAIAVNSKGTEVSVSLDSIYDLAKVLGENMTKVEY